jgi:serine/threonine protein kinase/TolB-like protein/Tfp pilus assembly protein PilF
MASAETTSFRVCGKCGNTILETAPQGLCSVCLLDTGLTILTETLAGGSSAVASAKADDCGSLESAELFGASDDYELLEEIGRGGQGVVYRARQKSLNRTVALKIIGLGPGTTKAHLKRFRLEAEAAARLNHPFVVPIHEIGQRNGRCYFSMGLVEGGRLDQIAKREPMSLRQAAELIAKLARTVHYAHEHGIVHRDIKPGNILLDAKGEPHLTDFGVARLLETENDATRTIEVLGTPSYMAPEQAQANNGQISSATDVYGLGAVMYQLLTRQLPFAGHTSYETVRLLLETEPQRPRLLNPKVDRDLSTICLKCLEKDPQRRYSSALALAEDLERWLKHEPIQARRANAFMRATKWVHRNPAIAVVIALSLILGVSIGWNVWKSELIAHPATTGIAVLPFENLSNDREDASFADGVQDDLLTKLANIGALKVISRTSVMQYRGERNLRQIGETLRVSHVLEGTVRKTGAWLHINAQLIDTRTDSHIWAKQYDGDFKDLFAIQSEIVQRVAEQLHAEISPAEKLAIQQPLTTDFTAFDLYNRAKNLVLMTSFGTDSRAKLMEAADLLTQAVAHDPSYFQAYCLLASAHDQLYFFGDDHTPGRLALAEGAVQAAFRVRPDADEAHLTRAWHLYRGYLDYGGALAELEIAGKTLPNDPGVFQLRGAIQRRQGDWEESIRNFERAAELDPRNVVLPQQIAITCEVLRRYAQANLVLDRVLAVEPNDLGTKVERALVEFDWKADTQPLHEIISSVRARNPSTMAKIADSWLVCALAERDAASIQDALAESNEIPLYVDALQFNRSFVEGLVARMMKDDDKARSAFVAARVEQEKVIEAQPDYGPALCVLGLIDAALGRKEEALREGWRAIELLPVEKDSINGPMMVAYFTVIAAWVGDKDLACQQLAMATRHPSRLSYGQLKLLPFWDPLRGDPRFEKIVASLAPK